MIELRTHVGPDSEYLVAGNRQTALLKTPDKLLTFSTGGGDFWIGMLDERSMLRSRFRDFRAGGGRSPCTFMALGCIVEAGIAGASQRILPHSHTFTTSRIDDENGMRLTACLSENLLALSLCDERGEQEDRGTTIKFDIALRDCPPAVQEALWSLPYAMLYDQQQITGDSGVRPMRPAADRLRHSGWDEAYWRWSYDLVGS